MSKRWKVIRNLVIILPAFAVVVVVTLSVVMRTEWFRAYVKHRVIVATEESTGGKVDIGSFAFEPRHMRALVTDFIIHGSEPAGAPPFLRAGRVELILRVFTSSSHFLDVAYLGLDRFEANVIVFPNGETNAPVPKKAGSGDSPLATVVDLAVGRFELTNGSLTFNSRKHPLNIIGSNLRAQLAYSTLKRDYEGRVSLEPVYVMSGRKTPVKVTLALPVTLGRDRVELRGAEISTAASRVVVNASMANLRNPKTSAQISGRLSLADLQSVADVSLSLDSPLVVSVELNATAADNRIDLAELRLAALGSEFVGSGSLENFNRYKLNGNLRNLDLSTVSSGMWQKRLVYDGVVSGSISSEGDLSAPRGRGMSAQARLSIAPGHRGIPVSGRLYSDYDGAAENISVHDSFLALPNSRLTLNGSLGKQLTVALTTRNLNDLLAAAALNGKVPVTLDGSQATVAGTVAGKLSAPYIAFHAAANRFSVEGRRFEEVAFDVTASSSGAQIRNGALKRGNMHAQFKAAVGLKDWAATPNQPLSAEASIRNGDLADIVAMAGQPSGDYSGALSANAQINGTVGNPRGTVNILAAKGTVRGEPFDQLQAHVNLADQLIAIPAASVDAGTSHLNLTAEFQHPRDTFAAGKVHVHIQSGQLDVAQIRTLQREWPNAAGNLQLQADVTGNLSKVTTGGKEQKEFLLAAIDGDASARALRVGQQNYGDLNVTARTRQGTVNYQAVSDFAGSKIRVAGNTQLVRQYPTTADAAISDLPIERALALAKRTDIPARGRLSGTAHFAGTIENPQGSVELDLANAVLHDEPVEHVRLRASYLPRSIDVSQFELVSGPSRIDLTARYEHPIGNLNAGDLQFRVNSGRINLARTRNVQEIRPGLGGTLQITAHGAASVAEGEPRVRIHDLNGNVVGAEISAQGKNFGDLALNVNTTGGRLAFTLDSSLAGASIHGRGTADLRGDYPVSAQLAFNNVTWTRFQALRGSSSGPQGVDAIAEGQATLTGPALKVDDLRAFLKLTQLRLTAIPQQGAGANPIVIQNAGPITATLDRSLARIESLHLTGPRTDIQARGTVSLRASELDLSVTGNTDLNLLQGADHLKTSIATNSMTTARASARRSHFISFCR